MRQRQWKQVFQGDEKPQLLKTHLATVFTEIMTSAQPRLMNASQI